MSEIITFSSDWTTGHSHKWKKWLQPFAGAKNIHGLEVGVYEGQSSKWFLENILTDPSSRLTCIDFKVTPVFAKVLQHFGPRIQFFNMASNVALPSIALRTLPAALFDFAYIDAGHKPPNVIEEAVLTWFLLKTGGVLIFDDYLKEDPADSPKAQIDAFLKFYETKLTLVAKGHQVCVVKK